MTPSAHERGLPFLGPLRRRRRRRRRRTFGMRASSAFSSREELPGPDQFILVFCRGVLVLLIRRGRLVFCRAGLVVVLCIEVLVLVLCRGDGES
ncbi:uncharacterized protein BO97DRAFT_230236 [Aspergillus homomorphus CBS 101889]|uniref:Uncharacterized protein n=1 Tax=Aspergillus homomorphus (strain CBS 101889) TaxID=1450537 RepID=A0A395HL91_ASPHC|nr:hypothetical protein BO97DRAFT_230236 [Aspergillus homomorphus CBS 101889]RAL07995.1 hypothetical protein BO97DRAFT_230236 [Aspergillus homomorphus CBS 101889]